MAGGARVPKIGMPIFPARTLLQEQFPRAVENENVHGAMPQVIPMHFAAWRGPNHAVHFVHHRKLLRGVRARPFADVAGWTKLASAIHCSSDNSSALADRGTPISRAARGQSEIAL